MSAVVRVGNWKKIDPEKEMHLGHLYEKDGKRALDKRCDYCGRWMTFDVKNIQAWGDNVKMGHNNWPEKVHCGSEHCQYYHARVLKHEKRMEEEAKRRREAIFFKLAKKGLVA